MPADVPPARSAAAGARLALRLATHVGLYLVFGGGLFAFAALQNGGAPMEQVLVAAIVAALWCGALTTVGERVAASSLAARVPIAGALGALSLAGFALALSLVAWREPQPKLIVLGAAFGALMQAARAWSSGRRSLEDAAADADDDAGTRSDAMTTPKQLVAGGALLIDVRTQAEWDAGHLDGARHLPLDQLAARIDDVLAWAGGDKAKPIVVHCRSGARSARARTALLAAGFQRVENGGGLDDLR